MKSSVPVAVSYNIEVLNNNKIPFHVRDNYAEELRGVFAEIAKALAKYDHERNPVVENKRKKMASGTGAV